MKHRVSSITMSAFEDSKHNRSSQPTTASSGIAPELIPEAADSRFSLLSAVPCRGCLQRVSSITLPDCFMEDNEHYRRRRSSSSSSFMRMSLHLPFANAHARYSHSRPSSSGNMEALDLAILEDDDEYEGGGNCECCDDNNPCDDRVWIRTNNLKARIRQSTKSRFSSTLEKLQEDVPMRPPHRLSSGKLERLFQSQSNHTTTTTTTTDTFLTAPSRKPSIYSSSDVATTTTTTTTSNNAKQPPLGQKNNSILEEVSLSEASFARSSTGSDDSRLVHLFLASLNTTKALQGSRDALELHNSSRNNALVSPGTTPNIDTPLTPPSRKPSLCSSMASKTTKNNEAQNDVQHPFLETLGEELPVVSAVSSLKLPERKVSVYSNSNSSCSGSSPKRPERKPSIAPAQDLPGATTTTTTTTNKNDNPLELPKRRDTFRVP